MKEKKNDRWNFINEQGDFQLEDPDYTSYLYFPLTNEAGAMSSISPTLHGDMKTSQNTFALTPVSPEDLHNSKGARNFWIYIEGKGAWSATGNSSKQKAMQFTNQEVEKVTLEAGLLWHKITRENRELGICSEITSFVPSTEDQVELMEVNITNIGEAPIKITPTAAIPLFGRSADNIRDHRHVTSLLHRTKVGEYGVVVKPTLSFDERGHKVNQISYGVLGADGEGEKPIGFSPVMEEFIGEGGSLEWPEVIIKNTSASYTEGDQVQGFETIGGLRFEEVVLQPHTSKSYVILIAISEKGFDEGMLMDKYGNQEKFSKNLYRTMEFWEKKLHTLQFSTEDQTFNHWMKWVTLQPVLRRIYGCSFLPYHDYGKGGRGWRDLWQDCLALLIMEPEQVRELLLNNYAGVRMDGSNATIIGSKPGEFIADRNNISRVWMDHGAWPFLTTKLYIDQTGDLQFLLEPQTYFKDQHVYRCAKIDKQWNMEQGSKQLDKNGQLYEGTILEHLLVQHLTAFFNVGEHNNIKLEGADWNDAFDMASDKGESVAFSALYASNLLALSKLLVALEKELQVTDLEIGKEVLVLLDTLEEKLDYDSVVEKHSVLGRYYDTCEHIVAGEKVRIDLKDVIKDLTKKGNWMIKHIRKNEWIENKEGFQWFNGYYDNAGEKLEGDHDLGVRMTLTGQVFPIMGGVATEEQIEKIVKTADQYLYDARVGGYRLNTDFHEVKLNMGRCFGFSFGDKENGAMFSHMAVMYGNALYQRGFVKEGYKVLNSIYNHCRIFEKSRIYPGIPEYINQKGRGMYPYLTGSASWMILTVLTQMYGVRGVNGDLVLEPKLLKKQFDSNGKAGVITLFADRRWNIIYRNVKKREYEEYTIQEIRIQGEVVDFQIKGKEAIISRNILGKMSKEEQHEIEVILG